MVFFQPVSRLVGAGCRPAIRDVQRNSRLVLQAGLRIRVENTQCLCYDLPFVHFIVACLESRHTASPSIKSRFNFLHGQSIARTVITVMAPSPTALSPHQKPRGTGLMDVGSLHHVDSFVKPTRAGARTSSKVSQSQFGRPLTGRGPATSGISRSVDIL
jgi:hypothetical protein